MSLSHEIVSVNFLCGKEELHVLNSPKNYAHGSRIVVNCCGLVRVYIINSFRVTSLALKQPCIFYKTNFEYLYKQWSNVYL